MTEKEEKYLKLIFEKIEGISIDAKELKNDLKEINGNSKSINKQMDSILDILNSIQRVEIKS